MLHDEIVGVIDYGIPEPKCVKSFYDNHKSENGELNFEPLEPLECCSLNLNSHYMVFSQTCMSHPRTLQSNLNPTLFGFQSDLCLILVHYNLT